MKGGNRIKNIANVITSLRIVLAVVIVLVIPFSTAFWVCYLCGGISDRVDGFIARKLNQQSAAGAKIDSIADLIFTASIFIVIIKYINFPIWLWRCALLIALLRIVSYGIGFYKYHAFSSLHTYLNKATGALIFAFPLLFVLTGLYLTEVIICFVAFVSSVEEIVIKIKSKELNRDCKSIFMK